MIEKRTQTQLETELLAELGKITRKIAELEHERLTVQGMLQRLQRESVIRTDATRSNGFRRVLVENKIIELLGNHKQPYSVKALLGEIKFYFTGMKPTTFRSYLHRMHERGVIESSGYGFWRLPEKSASLIPVSTVLREPPEEPVRPPDSVRLGKGR
jgi:hypothetical protein